MPSTSPRKDYLTLDILRSELQALADGLKSEIGQISTLLENKCQNGAKSSSLDLQLRENSRLSEAPSVEPVVPRVNAWVARRKEAIRAHTERRKSIRGQPPELLQAEKRCDPLETPESAPYVPLMPEREMVMMAPQERRMASDCESISSCRSLVPLSSRDFLQLGADKSPQGNGDNGLTDSTEFRSQDVLRQESDGVGSCHEDFSKTNSWVLKAHSCKRHWGQVDDSSSEDEELYDASDSIGSCSWYRFQRLVRSELVQEIACFVVILNAISVGIEAQYMAMFWTEELPACLVLFEKAFCMFFTVEILLRFCASGCLYFFVHGRRGNIFDLCATIMQWASLTYGYQFGKVLQLVRLVRILRVLRVFRQVGELRMLMASIFHSLKTFGWVMLLLMLTIYIVAVYLTMEVTTLKVRHAEIFKDASIERLDPDKEKSMELLLEWFGSLDKSMLSLYATVAEGVHWEELMEPLAELISPWMRLLFFCFSAIALFAVMNAITGVFVESAIHSATEDKKHAISNQMKKMFTRADDDGSGDITWTEFQKQIQSSEVEAALHEVDLDPEDARELFRLLDMDGSGTIDLTELVHGSYRLMGPAKSLDLAILMHEFRRMTIHQQKEWSRHRRFVEKALSRRT